ncbi:unnamed protein product [Amoebophrya sp. A25]|nr:unnamed protein product [Amoebophrya sp. A25]|eukprot:GSA25T00019177001.1
MDLCGDSRARDQARIKARLSGGELKQEVDASRVKN